MSTLQQSHQDLPNLQSEALDSAQLTGPSTGIVPEMNATLVVLMAPTRVKNLHSAFEDMLAPSRPRAQQQMEGQGSVSYALEPRAN